ncbi:MAG: putative sulfate exporter family transporter [Shimia sp.]|nr:putative sulfate exporter family transporter [Shimia sp.]|mmetsp:Transcript_27718/g.51566  ORF Transcript_27718/g.51566 Transcript_27718/m.51566 type:complete len:351 (-) Transcript_27718:2037-3089(-)
MRDRVLTVTTDISRRVTWLQQLVPGLLIAWVIALASQFISEHYGALAMLLALLFGISLNFFGDHPECSEGVSFGARSVLRLGVALLGLRISFDMIWTLGWPVVGLVVAMVPTTIAFGLIVSQFFGFKFRFAFLSAGAVAICGASAAIAIAAILPKDAKSEDRLVFTVVGVTLLSTFAMITYPMFSQYVGFNDQTAGIYLGATIHDVAQVVGAGFSISPEPGETATLVKLLRVAMLAPVIVVVSLLLRGRTDPATDIERPPVIPVFVLGFLALATLNSAMVLPEVLLTFVATGSQWLLLTAIAAVGLKTKPAEVLKVGRAAAGLLAVETLFLAVFVAVALSVLPLDVTSTH